MNFKFLLVAFFCATSASFATESIKVGVALRSKPELNSFADSLQKGIQLAADVFNAKQLMGKEGESNSGVRIELVPYSHQSGHESLSQVGRKIVADHVNYVLGGEMSDDAFTLAEEFQNHSILFMTATASVPHLTAGHPLLFRACFTDSQVARDLAKYVAGLKDIKSIGVLHNTVNAYTDSVTNSFLEEYERLVPSAKSGKSSSSKIQEFRYASEKPNFESAVEQFKKAKVDLVVAFTLQESLKAFFQSASKINLNPLYLGSDGWGTNESVIHGLIEGQTAKNFVGVRNEYWNPEAKTPAILQFQERFKKEFNKAPDGWSAIAYDSAKILFDGIAKAKNKQDANAVAAVLNSDTFTDTVTAKTIRFSRKNAPVKPLYLYQVNQGGVKFLKTLE